MPNIKQISKPVSAILLTILLSFGFSPLFAANSNTELENDLIATSTFPSDSNQRTAIAALKEAIIYHSYFKMPNLSLRGISEAYDEAIQEKVKNTGLLRRKKRSSQWQLPKNPAF